MAQGKDHLIPLRTALRDFDSMQAEKIIDQLFAPTAVMQLAHPFETLDGPRGYLGVLRDLHAAWPDLERRETIVLEGRDQGGQTWIGCCGYWTGTFRKPWIGIPATGHQAVMRFHEFYRLEGDKITEMQTLWDLPEVMMQAGVWPMGPSLGREWHVPGPATQDGLRIEGNGDAAFQIVNDMLLGLSRFADGGPEAMDLPRYWHPNCNWYGPSGIGTGRGISGFRNWHQIPFLNALPNRVGGRTSGHLFAQGNYVGFTGWPGMGATVTGDGWLGIAPAGQKIEMRSLDFWRVEGDVIRENWVLIDLLHVWSQLGVDVLGRARELAKARTGLLDP
ncbi:ester cyclase [Litoreibacter roseus]|uniref:Polyketide cyclase n=1 Tax=Litoreibacter roseus TaxID=2601869 RepID=A0A6N6JC65_9RHOB|nr:ester cyclase [Litoreibacter roseus]GFE62989.1 polyketide cyclase [Litoreibacter roseus]